MSSVEQPISSTDAEPEARDRTSPLKAMFVAAVGPRFSNVATPAMRVAVNVLAERDLLFLSRPERMRAAAQYGLSQTHCLPPTALVHTLEDKKFRNNVINYAGTNGQLRRLVDHPTSRFITQIVVEGRDYRDTELFSAMQSGKKVVRHIDAEDRTKELTRLRSADDFEPYYQRCMTLVESLRTNGFVDMSSSEGEQLRDRHGADGNITVAIDDEGRFIHYRRGRHRLAIAHALGVERVPVDMYFVSGHYLRKFFRRWNALVPGRLSAALARAVGESLLRATGSRPDRVT